jgi:ATP-dependent helicase/nuclease subunit A
MTAFDFTEQQARAIQTHDKNLIVVAGAGSGKTRVLVERYLNLLEKNPEWSLNALVAITFTREAAFEMRNRVRKELENRLHQAQIDDEAKRWSGLLAQMDSARIDTIHGLCATILRANAAEAGIDPRFEVLEPIDGAALLTNVINAVLRNLVNEPDDDIATLFTEYDIRLIREVVSSPEILAAELDDLPETAAELYQQWVQDWQVDYETTRERLAKDEVLKAAWAWSPPPIAIAADDKIMDVYRELDTHWNNFFEAEIAHSQTCLSQMLQAINLVGGKPDNWGGKDILAEAKDNLRSIRECLSEFKDTVGEPPNEIDKRACAMLVRWYRLLKQVGETYQAEKAASGYLDFNDLEARTAALLNSFEAVRQRYQGVEFKRLLVDEFQDTNASQWKIVTSLANIHDDIAMFVVGDQKQSIYGFRGADVSVFDAARLLIGTQLADKGEEIPLSVSFRSHPGLIQAFNKLFARILIRNANSPVAQYEIAFDHDMDASRNLLNDMAKQHYGSVELLLLETVSRGGLSAPELRLWEAHEIAQRLKKLYEAQAPIFVGIDENGDAYRPFDYGDAAILFQTTTHLNTYEEVLKALNIPFVTVAGRGYYNRQEVWDMLNLLKALHNSTDNLSLAAVLRSPMFGFSDEMLLALRRLRVESAERATIMPLWEALSVDVIPPLDADQMARVRFARDTLHELRALAGRVTISELLRRSLSKTGYLAVLTGLPGGARLRRNVEKLIDIAEASGKITLGAFSHYLDDLTAQEVREGEATLDASGAVRLMTVHASKGLEFPVVVLADASRQLRDPENDVLLYDRVRRHYVCKVYSDDEQKHVPSYTYRHCKRLSRLREEAEHKRLLYVAATRARDVLIIAGTVTLKKDGSWGSDGWLRQILSAIELDNDSSLHDGFSFDYTPHATIRLHLPKYDTNLPQNLRRDDSIVVWKAPDASVQPLMPPRMQPVTMEQERLLGHLAATQLANIGSFYYAFSGSDKLYFRDTVRRQILADSSSQIREAVRIRDPRIKLRQVGEVVHEALRFWRFPDNTADIDALLESYAWQQHITDPKDVPDVVNRAREILRKFQNSDTYREISLVKSKGLPYYSELPFIFRTDRRIIHGVMDALYQRENGEWVVMDYKTTSAHNMKVADHARRYHLQLGAYAAAVRAELGGIVPKVYIHYIQRQERIEIPAAIWQAEIQKLEQYIGELTTYD